MSLELTRRFVLKNKWFLLLATLMIFCGLTFAQSGQTGQIKGKVTTADGALLPGVTVKVSSPAMVIKEMTTVTNENGAYRFLGLAPGVYKVEYILDGMQTVVRSGITVNVSKTATLDIAMSMGKIEENIVIEGKAPTVDRQSVTKTSNIDNEIINSIPSGRSVDSYFAMAPGVSDSTAHGSSERDNAYNIDGVNLNDPVIGTQGAYMSADIMQEVSVQAGGISAEYGSATGAVINVVTKSGGNKLSGSASVHYEHEKFRGDNTKGTALEKQGVSGNKFDLEAGATLGGALLKDKLWFFGSMTFMKNERLISGYPYDKASQTPYDEKRVFPYFKLTFQPTQNDKLYVSYQFSDRKRNHRGANSYQTEETTLKQETPSHVGNFQWSHTFGSNFFMNAKIGIVRTKFNMIAKNENANVYNRSNRRDSEGPGSSRYNDRNRFQANVDGTYFLDNLMGSHELKFGASFEVSDNKWILDYHGDADTSNPGFVIYTKYFNQNADGSLSPYLAASKKDMDQRQKMRNINLFLQDTWNVTSNITLNLGVRAEFQRGIIPKQNTGAGKFYLAQQFYGEKYPVNSSVDKDLTVAKWDNIVPRLGLIYDIFSDGSTLFKATYGRYYAAMNIQWFNGMNPNGQIYYWGAFDPKTNQITSIMGASSPNPTTAGYNGKELKNPYTDEMTISVERELFEDWSVGARFIKKWSRNLLEDVNGNALDMDKLVNNGELDWKNYEKVTAVDPYTGKNVTFWNKKTNVPNDMYSINPEGAERDYTGLELTVNKRFSKGYSINASYVYSKTEGLIDTSFDDTSGIGGLYNDPNEHENAYGRLPNERRHYFKFIGLLKGPWGINIGTKLRIFSGTRYTRTVRSSDLGVSLNQGSATVYAEERGSRGLPTQYRWDLRLEKAFTVKQFTLRVFADCFNVLNEGKALSVWGSSTNNGTYKFGEMRSISSPRTFRFGAKVEF